MVELSILIQSYEREKVCQELVNNLNKHLSHSELIYEIIVMDNGSKNKYDFESKNTRIIRNDVNLPVPMSRNILVALSNFNFVFMLDDDVDVEPNTIKSLLNCLAATGADMAFPKKLDLYSDGRIKDYGFFKPGFFSGNLECFSPENKDEVPFGGMVYLARKCCVLYDEDFGKNKLGVKGYAIREESAMQAKVKRKVADLNSVIYHNVDKYSGGAVKDKKKIAYWTGYGNGLFVKRYFGSLRSLVWVCTWGIGHFILNGFNFMLFKGWWDGVSR